MALRIEQIDDKRQYGHLDHASDVLEYAEPTDMGQDWMFGGFSRSETAEHIRRGTAPTAFMDSFNSERDAWKSRIQEFAQAIPSRRRKLRHRDVGDCVDVGRYLDGDPSCWERMERGKTLPSITLGVSTALSADNSPYMYAQTIVPSAACAWALCEAGYSVRILGVSLNTNLGGYAKRFVWSGFVFPIKAYRDPLDVERFLSLGLPGFSRHHGFGVKRVLGHGATMGGKRITGGLGIVSAPTPVIGQDLGIDVFLGRNWIQTNTPEGEKLVQSTRMEGFIKGA